MEGEHTGEHFTSNITRPVLIPLSKDDIWGVVDILPETDFPDIRNRSAIHSHSGACMIIPREDDLVRLYIQLSEKEVLDPCTGRVDRSKMGPQKLLEVIYLPSQNSVYNVTVLGDVSHLCLASGG